MSLNPLLTTIATEVAVEFGSRLSAILAPSRGKPEDARARAITMWLYSSLSPKPLNYTQLGVIFDRDRTTVRHALARVYDWRQTERGMVKRMQDVGRRVQERL